MSDLQKGRSFALGPLRGLIFGAGPWQILFRDPDRTPMLMRFNELPNEHQVLADSMVWSVPPSTLKNGGALDIYAYETEKLVNAVYSYLHTNKEQEAANRLKALTKALQSARKLLERSGPSLIRKAVVESDSDPDEEEIRQTILTLAQRHKRVPTLAELRHEHQSKHNYKSWTATEVRRLAERVGFGWLPKAKAGRPQK
jgi:hypothetical protein